MSKKRQSSSSIVSIMDEDNLDLHEIDEDGALSGDADGVNYMNMDISTDNIEDIVTEDDYNYLYGQLHRLLGEHDEYLEVFDDNMQFSEVPVVHSIAEKTCDIYQDLKNFISSFRCGIPEVIGEALWQLNNSFELYWGKACAGVLRAVHHAVYQVKDEDD